MSVKNQVTPYADDDVSKKGQVTRMFDKIAPYYDHLNRVLSLGIDVLWRKKAISLLKKEAPKTILDIATGTADLAIEAARTIRPDQIIGMDISANMLKIGDEKIIKKGLSDVIKLELGDSENLRYDTDSFDAVMAAFGVRNFENLEKGLSEMLRVVRPGGRVVILEFSKPARFPFKQLYNFYFKYILPVIGRLVSRDQAAYTYLPESVQAFPDGENFVQILSRLGYKNTTCKPLTFGISSLYTGTK